MPRLVGDCAVAGPAQVSVRDEPGPQAVRTVRAGVHAGARDRLLNQGVDGLRVQRAVPGLVVLADRAEDRAFGDASELAPMGQGCDWAASGVAGARQHNELDPLPGLVRLRPGQRQHQAVGVLGDLVDRQYSQLAATQRGDEPDQQQGPIPRTGQIRLIRTTWGAPDLGGRAGVQDVEQLRGH